VGAAHHAVGLEAAGVGAARFAAVALDGAAGGDAGHEQRGHDDEHPEK